MNLLDRQLYEANFQVIGTQLVAWKDARPDNKTFDNLIKSLNEMYLYTNSLQMQILTQDALLRKYKEDNFDLRKQYKNLTQ